MELNILLRLIFAHILSDFIFQGNKMCKIKNSSKNEKYLYLLLHSLIHAIIAGVIIFNCFNLVIPLTIFITHFIIDLIKSNLDKDSFKLFIIDQLLHIIVIVALWYSIYIDNLDIIAKATSILSDNRIWRIIIGYILILKPTSIFISLFFKHLESNAINKGIKNAGKWIGYIERVLIITFILSGNISAVGFLLAAKSVFRFGELRDSNDIKTTEYVLIGTLVSFAIATLIGLLLTYSL
ncbi:MAG: DUF3307 domain-containing protein [Bacteroidales bacterium]